MNSTAMHKMTMKIIKGILAVVIGAVAYIATFSAFGETWFPYYYENYISYWFFTGLGMLLFLPLIVALYKKAFGPQYESSSYFSSYYISALGLNLVVVVACIFTSVYMLSNGVFLGGGNGVATYSIVPSK